ncbi:MAG: phosphoribosylformylglycinamidine synthase subunit PurL [Gemmataceae bacterium]
MLWEIEIRPLCEDTERQRVATELDFLQRGLGELVTSSARGYLLEGRLERRPAERLANQLLCDPLVETFVIRTPADEEAPNPTATVLFKPGVMDPAALSVIEAANDLGISVSAVRTFRRYDFSKSLPQAERALLYRKVLANDAIEQVIDGWPRLDHLTLGAPYEFKVQSIALRRLNDKELVALSQSGQLALSLDEMRAIQTHFRELDREPTDVELETIAQTWSEHCSHKTLKGRIQCGDRVYENLLKDTIFAATEQVRAKLGADDWCVSVFSDNAGVVKFDEQSDICFKVETHNRPSAIEPYGGANTGLGGVIRDVLGTGLGAKPIANTDVFCFAPVDIPAASLPAGVLHPRKVIQGVVAGVRDYGNRCGIPTVNGAVIFDERYVANPLVFCGTVGLIPVGRTKKAAQPGDLIVVVGGRTGRDGIHGATFSSGGLSHDSDEVGGGAVQIGNAITEKKVLDVLLVARDRGLYHAITDCGAGGFSSAVGEMGADLGAKVHLDRAPLKYEGLSYTEIWISEAQERMVLAVPPSHWPELEKLCKSEAVEATVLGSFEATSRLELFYQGQEVGNLSMHFLHDSRPKVVKTAAFPIRDFRPATSSPPKSLAPTDALKAILASPSVRSKQEIIRQYDHEVQGGSVLKPLVGVHEDGPGDAAVITPVAGSTRGIAIACGINPRYGEVDDYAMAAAAIDEAVRNLVAVGTDPARIALLDNFCWGDVNDPQTLGRLVRACEACRDLAIAWNMPFISGKDSLNNEYRSGDRHIAIPATLLISAMGIVPDVRRCVSMDLKRLGNRLYLVGATREEFGGSHYNLVTGRSGGKAPRVEPETALLLFQKMHQAILAGLVQSCHDLSEGGLAVAAAEMAFAGGIGADLTSTSGDGDETWLFSESPTRWLVEVAAYETARFDELFSGLPIVQIGITVQQPRLRIAGANGSWLIWASLDELKAAWQTPLWLV